MKSEKQCDFVLGRGGGSEEGKRADRLRGLLTQDGFFLFLKEGQGGFEMNFFSSMFTCFWNLNSLNTFTDPNRTSTSTSDHPVQRGVALGLLRIFPNGRVQMLQFLVPDSL